MTQADLSHDRLAYSVPEIAEALGVSVPTIYAAINAGALRSFTVGRCRRISRDAALDYIAQAEQCPAKADVSAAHAATRAGKGWETRRNNADQR